MTGRHLPTTASRQHRPAECHLSTDTAAVPATHTDRTLPPQQLPAWREARMRSNSLKALAAVTAAACGSSTAAEGYRTLSQTAMYAAAVISTVPRLVHVCNVDDWSRAQLAK